MSASLTLYIYILYTDDSFTESNVNCLCAGSMLTACYCSNSNGLFIHRTTTVRYLIGGIRPNKFWSFESIKTSLAVRLKMNYMKEYKAGFIECNVFSIVS